LALYGRTVKVLVNPTYPRGVPMSAALHTPVAVMGGTEKVFVIQLALAVTTVEVIAPPPGGVTLK
jgi:hypothetical protein